MTSLSICKSGIHYVLLGLVLVSSQLLIFAFFFPIFKGGCPFGSACLLGYTVPLCEMKKFEFTEILIFIPKGHLFPMRPPELMIEP